MAEVIPSYGEWASREIERRNERRLCQNCGLPVGRDEKANAPTGWTHMGQWQGLRCPGRITGAIPGPGAQVAHGASVDQD